VPPWRRVRNKNTSVLRMHYINIICASQTVIGRLFDITYNVGLLLYDLYYASCSAHSAYYASVWLAKSVVHDIEATEQQRRYC